MLNFLAPVPLLKSLQLIHGSIQWWGWKLRAALQMLLGLLESTNCCVGSRKKESSWNFNWVAWLKEESQSYSGNLQAGAATGIHSGSLSGKKLAQARSHLMRRDLANQWVCAGNDAKFLLCPICFLSCKLVETGIIPALSVKIGRVWW